LKCEVIEDNIKEIVQNIGMGWQALELGKTLKVQEIKAKEIKAKTEKWN
jgi:hypothetical protein